MLDHISIEMHLQIDYGSNGRYKWQGWNPFRAPERISLREPYGRENYLNTTKIRQGKLSANLIAV